MTSPTDKETLLFELSQAQAERDFLIEKRLELSDRLLSYLPDRVPDKVQREAWKVEREELERAIARISDKIERLLAPFLEGPTEDP
jgi:hypothetical protein